MRRHSSIDDEWTWAPEDQGAATTARRLQGAEVFLSVGVFSVLQAQGGAGQTGRRSRNSRQAQSQQPRLASP